MIEYFSTILQHERQTGFLVPLKTLLSWLVLLTAENLLKENLVSIPRFVHFMACQTTPLKFVTKNIVFLLVSSFFMVPPLTISVVILYLCKVRKFNLRNNPSVLAFLSRILVC
jgi:hypothetical protein